MIRIILILKTTKAMKYNLCVPDDEVDKIIETLQKENSKLTTEFILKAIASCCEQQTFVKKHDSFIDCVRLRIKMLSLI